MTWRSSSTSRTEPSRSFHNARADAAIKVRRELRHRDGARHRETIFEQRPIERFAIEGDKHRPFGDTMR